MIIIDGSKGEGGGQIVRTALFLSSLTKIPIKIFNIRKGRPKPGLKPQHLNIVKLLKRITEAEIEGDKLNSLELIFKPKTLRGGKYFVDFKTAGSITLFLQTILPVLIFADKDSELEIVGGTDVPGGMPIDYYKNVILPFFKKFADIHFKLLKRGFYPKGGGRVHIKIKPKIKREDFRTFNEFVNKLRETFGKIEFMERGNLKALYGIGFAHRNLASRKVVERIIKSANRILQKIKEVRWKIDYCDALSYGAGVVVWGVFENTIIGADSLGEPRKSAEKVGEEVGKKFLKEYLSNSACDEHFADNIIPFLALLGGKIKVSQLTSHIETNIWVCTKFFDKMFDIKREIILSKGV